MSVNAYVDTDTDTVYVQLGTSEFVKVPRDGEQSIVFTLPGGVAELVAEDDVDHEDAYNDGYDSGYSDGQSENEYEYTQDDLDDEFDRGYQEGRADALAEKEDDE